MPFLCQIQIEFNNPRHVNLFYDLIVIIHKKYFFIISRTVGSFKLIDRVILIGGTLIYVDID